MGGIRAHLIDPTVVGGAAVAGLEGREGAADEGVVKRGDSMMSQ